MESKRALFLSILIIGLIAGVSAWNGEYGVAGTMAGLISTITMKMFEK